jgi:hypothetical protein
MMSAAGRIILTSAGLFTTCVSLASQCPAVGGTYSSNPTIVERIGDSKALEGGITGTPLAMFLGYGAPTVPPGEPADILDANKFLARLDDNKGELYFSALDGRGVARAVRLSTSGGDFSCRDGTVELKDWEFAGGGDGGHFRTIRKRTLLVDGQGALLVRLWQRRERRDWLIFHGGDEATVTFRYARVSR